MALTPPISPAVAALFARRTAVAIKPAKQEEPKRPALPPPPAEPSRRHRRGSLLDLLV